MDYDTLIKNWHAKAADEDYFSKFVFEYLAFIGCLKRMMFPEANSDTSAVRKLKGDVNSRNAYLKKVEQTPELKEAWQKIMDELNVRPLGGVDENDESVHAIWYWDCSCEDIENPREHECEEQGRVRGFDDWNNMIEFWHSIRNNLFHGSKDPQDKRSQLLIKNGYITLQPLVEMFIENTRQRML